MSTFKRKWKGFWKVVWECYKQSFASGMMFFVASMIVMLILAKTEDGDTNRLLGWSIVCGIAATAYSGLLAYASGGSHYEMLVSGNMKRRSAMSYGEELKITSHKYEKEYRVWKGFIIGFFAAGLAVIGGIVLGVNQSKLAAETMGGGLSALLFILDLFAGWVMLPVQMYNRWGTHVSGFVCCAFVLIPMLVCGLCYIWGAYARRNKSWREQELKRKAEEAEANKPKKINYGGLPGTKPKKRK